MYKKGFRYAVALWGVVRFGAFSNLCHINIRWCYGMYWKNARLRIFFQNNRKGAKERVREKGERDTTIYYSAYRLVYVAKEARNPLRSIESIVFTLIFHHCRNVLRLHWRYRVPHRITHEPCSPDLPIRLIYNRVKNRITIVSVGLSRKLMLLGRAVCRSLLYYYFYISCLYGDRISSLCYFILFNDQCRVIELAIGKVDRHAKIKKNCPWGLKAVLFVYLVYCFWTCVWHKFVIRFAFLDKETDGNFLLLFFVSFYINSIHFRRTK